MILSAIAAKLKRRSKEGTLTHSVRGGVTIGRENRPSGGTIAGDFTGYARSASSTAGRSASTRPTSGSGESGATCTGPSTSTARRSTSC